MKKVINGRRYNTESAEFVGTYQSEFGVTDFNYYEEHLYLKKTGEFFIHGEGNGASPYCESYGNMWGPGEKLVPLTHNEAKQWVEDKLNDKYEELFEVEDEGNTVINVLVPESLHEKLRDTAEEKGVTQKRLVVNALEEYLN